MKEGRECSLEEGRKLNDSATADSGQTRPAAADSIKLKDQAARSKFCLVRHPKVDFSLSLFVLQAHASEKSHLSSVDLVSGGSLRSGHHTSVINSL